MEIKGEEFLKNVQIKQEEENSQQTINHIDDNEPAAYVQTSQNIQQNIKDEQELTNIMLEESVPNNEDNKKKYLFLALILIILFLTTILMIRLLNDDSSSNNDFNDKQNQTSTKSQSSIDEEYKKILDNRVNRQVAQNEVQEPKVEAEPAIKKEESLEDQKNNIDKRMDDIIEKINNKQVEQKVEEPVRKSPFVKREEPVYTPPKKVYTPVEKKVVKPEPKKEVYTSSSSKPRGYFIQVGAFSKAPADSYIRKIKNENLKYTVYQVEVKGRYYNKVLIGPYSSKASATQDINRVKNKLNITSAYVLKL